MATLVLGLALTAPAQPPGFPPPLPPGVRTFPPVVVAPPLRPLPPFRPAPPIVVGFPPPVVVPPPVVAPPAVPALTLDQFSRVFVPTAGRHHYLIVHPRTGQPVEVCFTLPHCGRLERLEVGRSRIEIELDRPDFEVTIEFRHNGTVRIDYDD